MKNKRIKLLSFIFLCIFLIPIYPAVALEDEDMLPYIANKERNYVISEYGAIMEELKMSQQKAERVSSYANVKEVNKAFEKRKEYHNYIYQLKDLSKDDLIDMNFNNSQIEAIKNFDGSDELAVQASASVSATLKLTQFKYTSSDKRTHASATFSGNWVGTPLYKKVDSIGIGMIGSASRFVKISSSDAITHYDGSVIKNTKSFYHSSAGQSYNFGICDINGKIFKKFTMTYTAAADGKNTLMDYGAAYAHYYESTSVGLSIGVSGSGASIGVSFSINNANANIEWKKIYPQSSYI